MAKRSRHAAVAAYYAPKVQAAYPSSADDDTDALTTVLNNVHTDAWVAGITAAAVGVGGAAITAVLDQVNLGAPSDWAPGWAETTPLPDTVPDGLTKLLDSDSDLASNIAGYQDRTSMSVEDQADQMTDTQSAIGAEAGVKASYDAAGYDQWNWILDAEGCEDCQEMADGGPYGSDDDGPPQHQRCDCSSEPVVSESAEGRNVTQPQHRAADDDSTPCPTCDGSGNIKEGHVTCPDCGGTGEVEKSALAQYDLEVRAKYKQSEIDEMGKKGEAFGPDDDGHYSYPIGDIADLKLAIHAVGRGNADHDAIRKYIIGHAKALGQSDLIPDNWNADGSLKESGASTDLEHRASHEPMIGIHSHGHPAFGSQGDDATHEHEHGHDGDADHDHSHAETNSAPPATAIRSELRNVPESRIATGPKFELREVPNGTGGTNLRFTGFASVTGDEAAYEMEDWMGPWTESVSVSAFDKTLSEGADVAFLLNHGGMTLARTKPGTLKLSAVKEGNKSPVYGVTGLHSEALLDPQNMYVQAMRSAVERGDLDEMSFAFRVTRQEWSENYDRRWINEVSLHQGDVSLVNYGANPTTAGTVSMRQRLHARHEPMDVRRLCIRLMEIRVGATLSAATMSKLSDVLDLIDASDTNVDKALIELSALMGVTNPDIAQDALLNREPEPDEQKQHQGLFPQFFQASGAADRVRLEALRHPPTVEVPA